MNESENASFASAAFGTGMAVIGLSLSILMGFASIFFYDIEWHAHVTFTLYLFCTGAIIASIGLFWGMIKVLLKHILFSFTSSFETRQNIVHKLFVVDVLIFFLCIYMVLCNVFDYLFFNVPTHKWWQRMFSISTYIVLPYEDLDKGRTVIEEGAAGHYKYMRPGNLDLRNMTHTIGTEILWKIRNTNYLKNKMLMENWDSSDAALHVLKAFSVRYPPKYAFLNREQKTLSLSKSSGSEKIMVPAHMMYKCKTSLKGPEKMTEQDKFGETFSAMAFSKYFVSTYIPSYTRERSPTGDVYSTHYHCKMSADEFLDEEYEHGLSRRDIIKMQHQLSTELWEEYSGSLPEYFVNPFNSKPLEYPFPDIDECLINVKLSFEESKKERIAADIIEIEERKQFRKKLDEEYERKENGGLTNQEKLEQEQRNAERAAERMRQEELERQDSERQLAARILKQEQQILEWEQRKEEVSKTLAKAFVLPEVGTAVRLRLKNGQFIDGFFVAVRGDTVELSKSANKMASARFRNANGEIVELSMNAKRAFFSRKEIAEQSTVVFFKDDYVSYWLKKNLGSAPYSNTNL